MSWYDEVKFIFAVFMNTMLFILWSFFIKILLNIDLSRYIYILNLTILFLTLYLSKYIFKRLYKNNRILLLTLIISILTSPVVYFLMDSKVLGVILNLVYSLVLVFSIGTFKETLYSYYQYQNIVRNSLIIIGILGVFMNFIFDELFQRINTFYFLILIFSILLLRESRNYKYKIRNKNAKKTNGMIFGVVMLMSIEPIYNMFILFFMKLKGYLSGYFDKFFYYIFCKIGIVINKVCDFIMQWCIKANLGNSDSSKIDVQKVDMKAINKVLDSKQGFAGKVREFIITLIGGEVYCILKILVFIIIVYAVVKLIKFIVARLFGHKEDEDEIVESIKESSNNKKHISIKRIFKSKGDIRDNIRSIYRKFLNQCYKKKVFKPYMSATVLSNVLKIKVDKNEELENLAKIYNEAKFSKHEMNVEKLSTMKKSYLTVDKYMKKL